MKCRFGLWGRGSRSLRGLPCAAEASTVVDSFYYSVVGSCYYRSPIWELSGTYTKTHGFAVEGRYKIS